MIEDDRELAAMVAEYLGRYGFEVRVASTAREGLAQFRRESFAAVLLDIMLPDGDGLDVCRTLRAESDVPVLMLTARGEPADRIVGLELGADDYLPKPFEPRELLARLKAVLRRGRGSSAPRDLLVFGRLELDRDARSVSLDAEPVPLTGYQFDLLWVLASGAGRVMTRDMLMDRLKGHEIEAFDRSLDVHVSRIRALIEDDPKHPKRILTVRGVGYVFAKAQD
ncbi:MAG: response regulator [Betaproteobacteria bacterium]|nr:response regulator [Betaproteobacteria bacterium]